jgi:hypothetical protein
MPLENLDDNLESNSSVDTTLDAVTGQPLDNGQQNDTSGADSSDAQGESDGTAGIVRDVVDKSRNPDAASPAAGKKDGADANGTEPKEEDNEEYSDVPFNKHPRFQRLIRERNDLRGPAGEYQKVQTFMDQNGISSEAAAEGFTIMAAMAKGDAVGAWNMLKPVVQSLLVAAGEVLPEDLKQRVAAGEMPEEAAREIATARAKADTGEKSRSFDQRMQQTRAERDANTALQTTASTWAQDRAKKDPNFDAKQPALMREVAYLIQTEGRPNTPEGVKAQLEKAYKSVALPGTRPAANGKVPTIGQGVARPRASSNGAPGNAQPQPRSTLDIIRGITSQRVA